MTDRELLERAARAAGIVGEVEDDWYTAPGPAQERFTALGLDSGGCWNPLNDDGDALRLAVRLGLDLRLHDAWKGYVMVERPAATENTEQLHPDPYAATRRAIVRAAAAMCPKDAQK